MRLKQRYSLIALALAISVVIFLLYPTLTRLALYGGHYPTEIEGFMYTHSYVDETLERIVHSWESGHDLATSSVQMQYADAKSYATVEMWWWVFKLGETQVSVQLSNIGISATHGDSNLLTPSSTIWDDEQAKMGTTDDNPKTITRSVWVSNETINENTTRIYYETQTFKVYRFWSTVTLTVYNPQIIAKVEYGTLDATSMKLALGHALEGINTISHIGPVESSAVPYGVRPCAIQLRLAIDPMAISSGEDWYGFLGAWTGAVPVKKAGTLGGSTAQINYEHPHDVIALYEPYRNPMLAHLDSTQGTRAYKTFESYPNLDTYTIEELLNIPEETLSNVVYLPIQILDMGVTYSATDGNIANPESFISYAGVPSLTFTYLYDVVTNSESTWYEDYIKPESDPEANCGNLEGYVRDEWGRGVGGASVTLKQVTGYSATSTSDGYYSINNIPSGEYVVVAHRTGYEDGEASTIIMNGQTTQKDITISSIPTWWMPILIGAVIIIIVLVVVFILYQYMKFKMLKGAVRGVTRGGGCMGMSSTWIPLLIGGVILVIGLWLLLSVLQNLPWWM